jgi:hypothetical protein
MCELVQRAWMENSGVRTGEADGGLVARGDMFFGCCNTDRRVGAWRGTAAQWDTSAAQRPTRYPGALGIRGVPYEMASIQSFPPFATDAV